ncbi:hypothetical protein M3583_22140 [Bacillus subtilis]|nr:hypothetical protein [Bacillus subtilis]
MKKERIANFPARYNCQQQLTKFAQNRCTTSAPPIGNDPRFQKSAIRHDGGP